MIALCGCLMQQQHIADRIKQSFPFVDLVFGTHVVHRLPELLLRTLTRKKRVFEPAGYGRRDCRGCAGSAGRPAAGVAAHYVRLQQLLHYCIVPYVRGRERSRQACDVLAEAKQLIARRI